MQQTTKDLVLQKFNIKISVTYEKYHFIVFIIRGFFQENWNRDQVLYYSPLYFFLCIACLACGKEERIIGYLEAGTGFKI